MSIKKSLFYFFILFSFNLLSQSNLQFQSATKGAACYEVCYYNNHLYAGAGNTLIAYKLDGPNASPGTVTFQHRFRSNIDNIQVRNGFMYVSSNHSGLSKWNVANPDVPVFVTEYVPAALDEAVYDIAFFGDTIFAALKTKMAVLRDSGGVLTLLSTFAQKTGTTRIHGLDVKGNMLAFTVGFSSNNAIDGVYIYNASSLNQIGFYNQTFCDPHEVLFGQNTNLLHVMGGTNGLDGLFYSLDLSNPANPVAVFQDTVQGYILLGSIAQPMNAEIINDTVYVATQGGQHIPFTIPFTCGTYVYSATSNNNVHYVTALNSGLYHFDIAIHNKKMYVASEWYGVVSVDISDLNNEAEYSRVLTGGWAIGADKYGNKLVQANEGYGIRLYDVSNIQNPVLIAKDTLVGFCMNADFSSNGNYVYAYYLTNQQFKVFDVNNNFQMIGSLNTDVGEKRTCVYQHKAISASSNKVFIIDVSTPANPQIQSQLSITINDMLVTPNGKLVMATNDSIRVYDITGTSPIWLESVARANFLQSFKTLAFYKDTLYAYTANYGLTRYLFNNTNNTLSEDAHVVLPHTNPHCMAVDSFGLYVGFTEYGVEIYNKKTLAYVNNYLHGLEFMYDNLWGIQDLFCKDNLIFLVEYFGQTSIFSNDNNNTIGLNELSTNSRRSLLKVFPNPVKNKLFVQFINNSTSAKQCVVFNSLGETVYSAAFNGNDMNINTENLSRGMYFISVHDKGKIYTEKFIVEE